MLIGFDASRAFVAEATGTENYSLNLLRALAKIDRKNKYRVYIRSVGKWDGRNVGKAYRSNYPTIQLSNYPDNFEFKVIRPFRLWTQLGLALETWKNPVDLLFVPAHTLPILRKRSILKFQKTNNKLQTNSKYKISNSKSFSFVHLNFDIVWDLVLGIWRFLSKQTRYVVTIHDLGVEYLPGYHQFPQRYYLDFASKYAATHADGVIAVSRATKHDLIRRYKLDGKKVFVVSEGVDSSFFRPRSKKEFKISNLKFKINEPYILFVGTVQPRKNLEMLIAAYSLLVGSSKWVVGRERKKTTDYKLRTTNLVIAGKLGWDYTAILAAPKKFGVEDKVKFLGHVPDGDLPALYSGATVFAFPSLFEGFGLPILEAISCDCPVVASDIAPHREIYRMFAGPVSSFPPASAPFASLRVNSKPDGEKFTPKRSEVRAVGSPSRTATRNQKLEIGNWKLEIPTSEEVGVPMILVKPDDVDRWASVLYQYISQYTNRKINVSKNRLLTTKFSWEDTAKKTFEVFERVLQ